MKSTQIAALALSILSVSAIPVAAQGEKAVVWSIAEAPKAVKNGAKFEVKLAVQIAEGWHLYSTTQAEGGPIPTRIWVPEAQPFKAAGPLRGSKPKTMFDENFAMKVEYHEDSAQFVLPLEATGGSGAQKLVVDASFQSCNDKLCLPPRTVKLETEINVK